MHKSCILIAFVLASFFLHSQIRFENGYFIDNNGEKKNCLIKNYDWKNNPFEIEFKLTENSEIKTKKVENVKEFGIYNKLKYISVEILIDRSSENLDLISDTKAPIFNRESLFLKVLIEGKASLFLYSERSLRRYFYRLDNGEIQQLVHKSFLNDKNELRVNRHYKQQLLNDLNCGFLKRDIEKLNYKRKDLTNFFLDYNNCKNINQENFELKVKRDVLNLSLRGGLNFSRPDVTFVGTSILDNLNFNTKTGFKIGLEAEFIFAFNNNKWRIVIEPTYQSYISTEMFNSDTFDLKYQSIELPVGLRHYFYLSEHSQLFINAAFVFDFDLGSEAFYRQVTANAVATGTNLSFGFGFKYKELSVESRYNAPRSLIVSEIYRTFVANYSGLSIMLGYQFL